MFPLLSRLLKLSGDENLRYLDLGFLMRHARVGQDWLLTIFDSKFVIVACAVRFYV